MEIKECCLCKNFDAYYTRSYCNFTRSNCGYCQKKKEIVSKHFKCENFKDKKITKGDKREIALCYIATAIININAIKDFLEEKT